MPTMTKTTVITWSAEQIANISSEEKSLFVLPMLQELNIQISKGATDGQDRDVKLPNGNIEVLLDWIDQDSAQAWLDFVLSTLRDVYGADRSYLSATIQDIVP